jgi:hypothetical protein
MRFCQPRYLVIVNGSLYVPVVFVLYTHGKKLVISTPKDRRLLVGSARMTSETSFLPSRLPLRCLFLQHVFIFYV